MTRDPEAPPETFETEDLPAIDALTYNAGVTIGCLPETDCDAFMKCIQDYALVNGP